MMTRELGDGGWTAACAGAPPPLHVRDHTCPEANWYPLPRPHLRAQPPGPVMVTIPVVAPFGDDPLDPTAQTRPRMATGGMISFLNARPGAGSVRAGGVRG